MQQLVITHCQKTDIESLSDLLELCGALSVTMTDQFDDPILEPELGTLQISTFHPLWTSLLINTRTRNAQ